MFLEQKLLFQPSLKIPEDFKTMLPSEEQCDLWNWCIWHKNEIDYCPIILYKFTAIEFNMWSKVW